MADNAITLQGLSAITRFIGRSTFQTQDQHLVLGWFVITTNHPLKSVAVWLFPGTSLEKEPPRVCPLERDDSSLNQGFALLDKGDHMVSGLMDNSVVAAFYLRHRSCSDKSSELCLEAEVLNPTTGTFFTMDAIHGKVGLPNFVVSQPRGVLLHTTPRMMPGTPLTQSFDVLTARVFQEKKP